MSVQPPSSTNTSSNHRTGGVADYFAILGVGDTLVLKSTQKDQQQYEDEAPPPPPPPSDQSNDDDDGAGASDADDAEKHVPASGDDEGDKYGSEEECAWMERFYREIVEVAVVTSDSRGGGSICQLAAGAATTAAERRCIGIRHPEPIGVAVFAILCLYADSNISDNDIGDS